MANEDPDLRRYLRDLVALSSLPAMWVGQTTQEMLQRLADALMATMRAEFVCVQVGGARATSTRLEWMSAAALGETLWPGLRTRGERERAVTVAHPSGQGTVRLAIMPIGKAGGRDGPAALAVASLQADFPSRLDMLLLRVAANQASAALQAAQLAAVQVELAREQRFRALVEHSSDMISLHTRDRTMTYVSPAVAKGLGYDPAELVGTVDSQAVHPDDRERLKHVWEGLAAVPGAVSTFRYRLRHKDGSWRWVDATGTNLLDNPTVAAVVINRRDVTNEVEAQRLLEQRVEERTRELQLLYGADELLHRSLRLEDVLQASLAAAVDLLRIDNAAVLVLGDGAQPARLTVGAARGDHFAPDATIPFVTDEVMAGHVETHTDLPASTGIRTMICVPIFAAEAVHAIFVMGYTDAHAFTVEERRLLGALAVRAGVAIENARLYGTARSLAALEERQKLARELHDSVAQVLYAIALNGAAAQESLAVNQAGVGELIEDVIRLARAGTAEMRALIFELRPESLESEGLVAALEKQLAAIRARHGLRVEADLETEPDISLMAKEALYRVTQEALHNVVKHAGAQAVAVSLTADGAGLRLRIADDGRGFDPHSSFPGHLGLRSMRERIDRLGGELDIHSAPGQGTRIAVRLAHG